MTWCKECVRENSRIWYQKNKEKHSKTSRNRYEEKREELLEQSRARFQRTKVRDRQRRRIYAKKWREENRDHLREYEREYRKEWSRKNPGKKSDYHHKRKASLGGGTTSVVNYDNILKRDGMWCYLGGHIIEGNYHFDHIIPLSKGGSHSEDNIAITCQHHNTSKGSKSLLEYLLYVY